jgi:hypothetical protein
MGVTEYLKSQFTGIGWFLQQGNEKSRKLSAVAFFFSRVLEQEEAKGIMEKFSPVYDSLTQFCNREKNTFKGGVLNISPPEGGITEEEELANLRRFRNLVAGVESEGVRRILILMENSYSPEFLVQFLDEIPQNSSEGYTMAWMLYLLIFDEASLETILPIIISLDSQLESF